MWCRQRTKEGNKNGNDLNPEIFKGFLHILHTWILSICPANISRETAWVKITSTPVGPDRIWGPFDPLLFSSSSMMLSRLLDALSSFCCDFHMGDSFATKDSGTNSVNPTLYLFLLSVCISRIVAIWCATWCTVSMCPYLIEKGTKRRNRSDKKGIWAGKEDR